jgi:hypothetical protein
MSQWVEDLPAVATILTRSQSRWTAASAMDPGCRDAIPYRAPTPWALPPARADRGPWSCRWLHKSCGMPFAKIAAVFAELHLTVNLGALSQALDFMADESFATCGALREE